MSYVSDYDKAIRYSAVSTALQQAVQRWKGFKPTKYFPSPGRHITNKEFDETEPQLGHPQDFHDAAAVLAGSKPAALLSEDFYTHPVGKEVIDHLQQAGMHSYFHPESESYVIGKPDAVSLAKKSFTSNGINHRTLGTALGYPKEAIDDFEQRKQSGQPITVTADNTSPEHR